MHNGFVNIDQRKMSKSLGNFFTVRDLAKLYPYDVIRFFILQAHYRMPINFSDELLDAAVASWQRINSSIDLLTFSAKAAPETASSEDETIFEEAVTRCLAEWQDAMDDDLNTADALAAIFDLVRAANTAVAGGRVSKNIKRARRLTERRSRWSRHNKNHPRILIRRRAHRVQENR